MAAGSSSAPWRLVVGLALAVSGAAAQPGGAKVMSASAPRSGTQSLAFALQRLGFHTIHTGGNWSSRAALCGAVDKEVLPPSAVELFDSVDAIVDEPVHLLFRQFLKAYPDGKVILSQRSPEKWYLSWARLWVNVGPWMLGQWPPMLHSLVARLAAVFPAYEFMGFSTCQDVPYRFCAAGCYWGCDWFAEQTPEIMEACKASYAAHNAAVLETVPAEQLLVWGVWEGWRPLCKFLGVSECPIDEPFPHIDFQTAWSFEQTPVVGDRPPVELPKDLPLIRFKNTVTFLAIIFGPWLLGCCCCRAFHCCCFRRPAGAAAADRKKRA